VTRAFPERPDFCPQLVEVLDQVEQLVEVLDQVEQLVEVLDQGPQKMVPLMGIGANRQIVTDARSFFLHTRGRLTRRMRFRTQTRTLTQ
jgi:hypothetical protein